jgi:hypothetical protein
VSLGGVREREEENAFNLINKEIGEDGEEDT